MLFRESVRREVLQWCVRGLASVLGVRTTPHTPQSVGLRSVDHGRVGPIVRHGHFAIPLSSLRRIAFVFFADRIPGFVYLFFGADF